MLGKGSIFELVASWEGFVIASDRDVWGPAKASCWRLISKLDLNTLGLGRGKPFTAPWRGIKPLKFRGNGNEGFPIGRIIDLEIR